MKISLKYLSKIIISTALISTFSSAGLVNAISVIIDNKPITLYEIYKYARQFKVSTQESLNLLIRKKLEEVEIKKFNIVATDFEVNNYVKKLATKSGISEFQFYEMLKSKSINEQDYKSDLKKKLELDKLYKRIIQEGGRRVKLEEVKAYYDEHKSEFNTAKSFDTTIYMSKNRASLLSIQKNPMLALQDVQIDNKSFKTGAMDQNLEGLLNKTEVGKFTQAFNTGDHFTMFYLKEKIGNKTLSFDKVKNFIYQTLSSGYDKKSIDNYFNKIRSVADIKILRKPNS